MYSECKVPRLKDLTDPEAKSFEEIAKSGTPFYTNPDKFHLGNELACLQRGITSEGGIYTNVSAYRPAAYQDHLREVWDAWKELNKLENRIPACDTRRQEVAREFNSIHDLVYEPAKNSEHSSGYGFDLRVNMPADPVFDKEILAWACGLRQFNPGGDPNHFGLDNK